MPTATEMRYSHVEKLFYTILLHFSNLTAWYMLFWAKSFWLQTKITRSIKSEQAVPLRRDMAFNTNFLIFWWFWWIFFLHVRNTFKLMHEISALYLKNFFFYKFFSSTPCGRSANSTKRGRRLVQHSMHFSECMLHVMTIFAFHNTNVLVLIFYKAVRICLNCKYGVMAKI